jgi:hypothetical protein
MEIKVEDFNIKPIICPANLLTPNCAPCIFAKTSQVHNCPVSSRQPNFGFVDCTYIEKITKQIEEANKRGVEA